MGLLCRGVPNSLAALFLLRSEELNDVCRHLAQQGLLEDIRGFFEEALLDALLDDLPDGRLRKGPEVYFP